MVDATTSTNPAIAKLRKATIQPIADVPTKTSDAKPGRLKLTDAPYPATQDKPTKMRPLETNALPLCSGDESTNPKMMLMQPVKKTKAAPSIPTTRPSSRDFID